MKRMKPFAITAADADSVLLTSDHTYWCSIDFVGESVDGNYRYAKVMPFDDTNKTVEIRTVISRGMNLADELGHTLMRSDLIAQFDAGMREDWKYGCPFDAELADVILQLGIFGDIIYG